MFGLVTDSEHDKNALSNLSGKIIRSTELNEDMQLKYAIQESLKEPSKLVQDRKSGDIVSINDVRSSGKAVKDTRRFYHNDLMSNFSRKMISGNLDSGKDPIKAKDVAKEDKSMQTAYLGYKDMTTASSLNIGSKGSTFNVTTKKAVSDEFETFCPFRNALVKRMQDHMTVMSSQQREFLHRLMSILSGGEDDLSLVVLTVARDSTVSNPDWKDNFNINCTIDVMILFFDF